MLPRTVYIFFVVAVSCARSFGQQQAISVQQAVSADTSLAVTKNLSDSALLDLTEKQTIGYFWDFGDPVSGMARERSNQTFGYGDEVVTTGGTGFGVMALIVGVERKWLSRDTVARRLLKLVKFLSKADAYHGVFPHWMNGATGKTIPFSRKDDGADLVETSYLFAGLLCAKAYFDGSNHTEQNLRSRIGSLWDEIEWNWFTRDGQDVLYWHWSPNNGWAMNFPLRGYNETLITYILAASATKYSVPAEAYSIGWPQSDHFINGNKFYGFSLPLGFDYGGPLFFAHYSFLGLDPHGLHDKFADYWEQNLHHTLINHAYCVDNPKHYKGYGEKCWGLTASDDYDGYAAHSPTNDLGVISPTAALSSFPYSPDYSMQALRHFYFDLGNKIWGRYGFVDAFSEAHNWFAKSYLAIDEGPIVVMIENYRSGLLWKLFMKNADIQRGLKKLGYSSPYLTDKP